MKLRLFLRSSRLLALAGNTTVQNAATPARPACTGPVFRIGNIGCGGRGAFVSEIIKETPGFKHVAAADCFEDRN